MSRRTQTPSGYNKSGCVYSKFSDFSCGECEHTLTRVPDSHRIGVALTLDWVSWTNLESVSSPLLEFADGSRSLFDLWGNNQTWAAGVYCVVYKEWQTSVSAGQRESGNHCFSRVNNKISYNLIGRAAYTYWHVMENCWDTVKDRADR